MSPVSITIPKGAIFFDTPRVLAEVEKTNRQSMARAGGYIRAVAIRSMKTTGGHSRPGSPPHAHRDTGELLKKLLFFAYDPATKSTVIGPVGFSGSEVPSRLEYGHIFTARSRRVLVRYPGGGRGKGRTPPGRRWVTLNGRIAVAPRPFMGPALRRSIELGKIPEQWRGRLGKQ